MTLPGPSPSRVIGIGASAGGIDALLDPVEAIVPSMPEHAITEVGAAAEVLSATAIGEELARLGPAPDIEIRPLVEAPT